MRTYPIAALASAMFVAILVSPAVSQACAVCFGDPKSPMTKGLNSALFVMIGVTYVVIIGGLAMFIRRAIRSRRANDIAEQGEHVAC